MIEVECVARGYISGSGWKDYQRTGAVCGIPLPTGLRESDKLAGADLHARHQGANRPRRKHFVRTHDVESSARSLPAKLARSDAGDLPAGRRLRAVARHHHRRYEIRIRHDQRPDYAGRRSSDARFVALLAAGDPMRPAARSLPTTSSTFAITSNRSTGTSSLPRLPFPTKWRGAPAKNIKRPTAQLTGKSL